MGRAGKVCALAGLTLTRRKAAVRVSPRPSQRAAGRSADAPRSASPVRAGLKAYAYFLLLLVIVSLIGAAVVWARPMWVLGNVTKLRLALKGFHGEDVEVDGHRIHYLEGGHGPVLVLVHGLGGSAQDWANLMPQLAAGGFHVYALDLLGYGESDKPRDATYSVAQEASVVEGFLRARELQQVSLGGWSMGGWVAARVALDAPQRIAKLMLFDAAGIRFAPSFEASVFTPKTPEQLRHLYGMLRPNAESMPDFLVRDILRRQRKNGWVTERSAGAMFAAAQGGTLDGKLGALKMPVLIAWGKEDRLLPVATAVSMHREIPQSVLVLFDGCGHLAPGQCADRVGPRMLAFLKGELPPQGSTLEVPERR